MSTASKFADEIYTAVLSVDADQPWPVTAIDRALVPVRECLEGLRNSHGCWCHATEDHEFKLPFVCGPSCLAAQQLYKRLKIQ